MRACIRTACLATISALLAGLVFAQSQPTGLAVARYDAQGQLEFPAETDRWIGVGTGLGGNYADVPFDTANPGSIGVVQMEPTAYDYFLRNGRYADGTMFLLTFYATQKEPNPALQGFVQGDVVGREIHVIDKSRFTEEGSGFFVFSQGTAPTAPMPIGSVCVQCHSEHGAFDGTFVQFYPALRGRTSPVQK